MPTKNELKMFQNYPLEMKIAKSKLRIREWVDYYGTDGVYISFSGGKDSTVLLHLVRSMYPDIEAVFVNTGLEFPEIQSFVKTFDNVTILRPKMRFDEVIRKYGYPVIGKKQADTISGGKNSLQKNEYSLRLMELGIDVNEATEMGLVLPDEAMIERYRNACKDSKFVMPKYKDLLFVDFAISPLCCNVMKKAPMFDYQKKTGKVPFTATMTTESMVREAAWLKNGCNAFNAKHKVSNPLSFWTEQDILQYILENDLQIASVYGQPFANCNGKLCTPGCDRTGCIFCGFGAHLDKGESRFERLKRTHPRQYEYCLGGGAYEYHCYIKDDEYRWHAIELMQKDGKPFSQENAERFYNKHKDDSNYQFTKLWKPTKDGLGMKHVFDVLNSLYGENFIKY